MVAYLGGHDISKGRWDTAQHCLFSTLAKEHANDFRNKFINLSSKCGPRQPWHDTHARVSGPATLNLLKNFRERWGRERRRLLNIKEGE